jgi:hypothetical protein
VGLLRHDLWRQQHEGGAGDDAAEEALGHVVAEHVGDAAAGKADGAERDAERQQALLEVVEVGDEVAELAAP